MVVKQEVGSTKLLLSSLLLALRRLVSETPKSALARRPIPLMIQPLLSLTVRTFYWCGEHWALEEMLPRKMLRVSRELELLHDTIGGEIGIEACTGFHINSGLGASEGKLRGSLERLRQMSACKPKPSTVVAIIFSISLKSFFWISTKTLQALSIARYLF